MGLVTLYPSPPSPLTFGARILNAKQTLIDQFGGSGYALARHEGRALLLAAARSSGTGASPRSAAGPACARGALLEAHIVVAQLGVLEASSRLGLARG